MKTTPNYTNTTFTSRIIYNHSLKKGFEYAREKSFSNSMKDLELSKDFIKNLYAIKNDTNHKTVSFNITQHSKINQKNNGDFYEGKKCIKKINKYASKLPQKLTFLDTIEGQINGAKALVSILEENYKKTLASSLESSKGLVEDLTHRYQTLLQDELELLETQISKKQSKH